MDALSFLINEKRKGYLCFETLRELYESNEEFKNIIDEGIQTGEIIGFPEELWIKIDEQNIRGLDTFERVFMEGYNIGGCTIVSKQLSYSFTNCYLCSGLLPLIKGTKNSPNGEHSWMMSDNQVYDTTLMIIMSQRIANKLGYQTEAKYNPRESDVYNAAYEFTNDRNIKGR